MRIITASSGVLSSWRVEEMVSGGDAAKTHTALALSWCISISISEIAFTIRRYVVSRERAESIKEVGLLSLVGLTRWASY